MALDLKVPSLGESVSEAFIGTWVKKDGEAGEDEGDGGAKVRRHHRGA